MAKDRMFPNKGKMVRSANFLFVTLAVAPVLYLVTAVLATFGRPGLGVDPNIIPWLFIGLALVSLANIGVAVLVQSSTKLMSVFYGIGFTIVTWTSLWWVRKRFKQNLASLPDA